MNLFDMNKENVLKKSAPLADRLRPRALDEIYGQEHILGKGKLLRRLILSDKVASIILYGPPGTGKTTIASVIAETTKMHFEKISAVTSGVAEMRKLLSSADDRLSIDNVRTILFIDEIHRFNKGQQDALLPYVERGIIILIGATTENPFYEINRALISRCQIFELKPISDEEMKRILQRAISDRERGFGNLNLEISDEALDYLIMTANGDARAALNALEIAVLSSKSESGTLFIDRDTIAESMQQKFATYDKGGDEHYNTISAFIKSIRGSDPDAALYYFSKMINAGEDPKFIARRLIISASEDIGNADPMGIVVATSAFQGLEVVGMPEAKIILGQAITYLACAPKSNSSYLSVKKAEADYHSYKDLSIPLYLRDPNSSTRRLNKEHVGYKYPHEYPGGYVKQQYLPDEIKNRSYYRPKNIGHESAMLKRLESIHYFEEKEMLEEEDES